MSKDERLELGRALVQQLESGDEKEAERILDKLLEDRERTLYQEVGRLTRELHEAINNFLTSGRIPEIAEQEIPDARQRLNYVIDMTEKSANTTLGAVEAVMPVANELSNSGKALSEAWEQVAEDGGESGNAKAFDAALNQFVNQLSTDSTQINEKLSEVLMAQEYQDLTGQIIRQVITLVHDVESKLVELIKISGSHAPDAMVKKERLEGPAVPGLDDMDGISGQDDVDELLSSLGF